MATGHKRKRDPKVPHVTVQHPQRRKMPGKTTISRLPARPNPRSFRILDLPLGIRNNIYKKVLEDNPQAHLSRFTSDKSLLTDCRLIVVSKQVREEFMKIMNLYAPIVRTAVRNFNFSHVFAYFNRISDSELHRIAADTKSTARTLKIELDFDHKYYDDRHHRLQRWLNRVDHTTKKDVDVDVEYEWHRIYWPPQGKPLDAVVEIRGPKAQVEWDKMVEVSGGELQRIQPR